MDGTSRSDRLLKRTREVRALSATDVARAAGISAAYLSKLENDAVKKPSPPVLHQLSEALAVPYAELMRLSGYRVPGRDGPAAGRHDRRGPVRRPHRGRARRAPRVPGLVPGAAPIVRGQAAAPAPAADGRTAALRDAPDQY